MLRLLLSLLLVGVFLTSCKTIQIRHLDTSLVNTKRLPALEPIWKPASLEVLHYSQWDTLRYASTYAPVLYPLPPSIEVYDARTLFEREVTKNITEPLSQRQGYITCQVVSAISRPRQAGLLYLTVALMGTPALFGVPQMSYQTQLQVEVQVQDKNHQLMGLYSAIGEEKIPVALYYGYRADDAKRLANINAFKEALHLINQQMQADYERLTAELNKH